MKTKKHSHNVEENINIDEKMNKIQKIKHEIDTIEQDIKNNHEMIQTKNNVITYPKMDVSLNRFRKEKSRLTKTMNKKGSSFLKLFERRISKIPGK